MNLGTAFWVLVLVAVVFGAVGYLYWSGHWWTPLVNNFFLFVLCILLGWQVFGPALRK